jgi:arylsulfatase A-like enzyme
MKPFPTSRRLALVVAAFLAALFARTAATAAERPNIVWILVDDMSAHFACYGETAIRTPNVDRLASEGIRFARAFVTAPICSISRSALLTGCYQTSIGCQNHRSGSAKHPIHLPTGMTNVAQLLKEAGYHTSNLSLDAFLRTGPDVDKPVAIAKTDYNFVWSHAATYDTNHWATRPAGQPFFVQVQLHGGKHRGQRPGPQWPKQVRDTLGSVTPTNAFTLPPCLPDDPVVREDWAQYLDAVRYTDWEVGRIVERLRDAGELERTVIFFWTDHGISHVRHKQFLYDGGIHIPLIARGPGLPRGRVRDDLVEHIDIAGATLARAGLARPATMQARDFLAADYPPREFVFAARDRADETVDRIRSVRSTRFKYIRNYYPDRPYLQPNRYKDEKAIVQAVRRLGAEGRLNRDQALILAETRPREEFYDLEADPHELRNLAGDPAHTAALARHRAALEDWIRRTDDRGRVAEPEDVYLDYVADDRPEGGRNQRNEVFQRNIELMLRWAKEKPMKP